MTKNLLSLLLLHSIYGRCKHLVVSFQHLPNCRNHNFYLSNTIIHTAVIQHRQYCTTIVHCAKPLKRETSNAQIDSYQTVSIYCKTCALLLFRYKKKNGTKSGLVKCYVERIIDDCAHLLRDQYDIHYNKSKTNLVVRTSNNRNKKDRDRPTCAALELELEPPPPPPDQFHCPTCQTKIARYALIHGLPALKWVGGKIRMAKK
jgi:DNA-directed RNA polymerase subunit M/transcription elongation factor TFIIS